MIAVAIWPLVFTVVGILMFAICTNDKLREIGKWVFIIGFFFVTSVLASQQVHLPPH